MPPPKITHGLSYSEFQALARTTPEKRIDYVAVLACAGLTPSELHGIVGRDYDHFQKDLRVGGRSARTIPVHPVVARILLKRATTIRPGEPLFPRWHNIQRQLPALCERARVPPITAKDLQVSFLRWLAEARVPEGIARELVGRGSSRLVVEVYRSASNRDLRAAISRLPIQ